MKNKNYSLTSLKTIDGEKKKPTNRMQQYTNKNIHYD